MNRLTRAALLCALLSTPALAQADRSVTGTYSYRSTENGQNTTGTAVIDAAQGSFTLRLTPSGHSTREIPGRRIADGRLLFVYPTPGASGGLLANLEAPLPTEKRATVRVSSLSLREGPGTEHARRGAASGGDVLAVIGRSGYWYQVRLPDGRELWASAGSSGKLLRVEQLTTATSAPGARSLLLERTSRGLRGVIQDGAEEIGQIQLERKKTIRRALLVWSFAYTTNDQNAFHAYANRLDRYYRGQGYRGNVVHKGEIYLPVIEMLEEAGRSGQHFSRLVIIGHGGWDGPVIGHSSPSYNDRQISGKQAPESFLRFVNAIRSGMTPDGKILSSSCHAAGSNKYERYDESEPRYNWVHDLALRTGRTVAGPSGYTSTEYTFRHVLSALEGTGSTRQEVHVASSEGLRIIYPGRTLAGARLTPIPPIAQLPKPEAVAAVEVPDPDNEGETVRVSPVVADVPLGMR